jgi:hypothetical protein
MKENAVKSFFGLKNLTFSTLGMYMRILKLKFSTLLSTSTFHIRKLLENK